MVKIAIMIEVEGKHSKTSLENLTPTPVDFKAYSRDLKKVAELLTYTAEGLKGQAEAFE